MFGFMAVKNASCAEIGRIFHMTGHMLCPNRPAFLHGLSHTFT